MSSDLVLYERLSSMMQENDYYQPLWTSTLEPGLVLQRKWTSSMKGGCWQDLVVALPVRARKLVEEERRGLIRFFKQPKYVRLLYRREARLPEIVLVSIGSLKAWVEARIIEVNKEDRFVVSTVERGVLHVE